MSNPAISLTTATVGRHQCPQKRLQTPAILPSTRIRARIIAPVTPSPPFHCPHAVHPCPSVDSGLGASPAEASTIAGAFRWGRPVYVEEMRAVDLVISGSVAVNRLGTRVGKGGGFADLEYGLAIAAGIVTPETPVVSTVHPMQLLDEELPYTQHDVFLDYVVTPDEIIRCEGEMPRPTGIYWDDLTPAKIRQIPLLKKLQEQAH